MTSTKGLPTPGAGKGCFVHTDRCAVAAAASWELWFTGARDLATETAVAKGRLSVPSWCRFIFHFPELMKKRPCSRW